MKFEDAYFQEEEREGFVISSMMKRAWAAQLEVLDEIRRVCQELGISYYGDFGTLLGAVRHGGFIPWDDDVDIGMLRKDYNLFLEKAPGCLGEWYELKSVYNDPDFDIVKARVINGRHMNFDPRFLDKFHKCPYVVGIDIFPVDNVPDDMIEYEKQIESLNFLLRVEASIAEEGPYSRDELDLMQRIEETYGVTIDYSHRLRHEVKRVYDTLSARYVNRQTKEVGRMLELGAGWKGYRYDRKLFEDTIEMPFEKTTLPVPAGYDSILRSCYGEDYMTPKNVGASHDYPFYKNQMEGLKEVMEKEFHQTLTDAMMEQLIDLKISASDNAQ